MSDDEKARLDETRQAGVQAAARVAAGLLHEFRNVLNPIVSAVWLLEANANDPQKVIELARRIDGFARADARIAARVRELLDKEATGQAEQPPQ